MKYLPCPQCGRLVSTTLIGERGVEINGEWVDSRLYKVHRHKWERPENIDAGYVREWCIRRLCMFDYDAVPQPVGRRKRR